MWGSLRRVLVVMVLGVSVAGMWWMFRGAAAGDSLASNADVVGAIAGVAALVFVAVRWWPRRDTAVPARDEEDRLDAAAAYLARQTLQAWREEAKARRVTTPTPALVLWQWAGREFAAPATELPAGQAPVLLTEGEVTRLRELYERLPAPGRMVILGGPGAGKTTAMLLLLIDLLERGCSAASRAPVPVWVTMGSWQPSMPLMDHAAAVLNRDYPGLPGYLGPDTARRLLETGRVALFLDGLDEMTAASRGPALKAIDEATTHLPIVLTSRPEEYQDAIERHRLWNTAVIDLLPVDVEHACTFLLHQQTGAHYAAWLAVTDQLRAHPDGVAARTLRDPLSLVLARDTYSHAGADPAGLLTYTTTDDLRRHLFTRLLSLAYPDQPTHAHAVYWLTWIARNLNGHRDIAWWHIPTWMRNTHPRLHARASLMMMLLYAIVLGTVTGLAFGLVGGPFIGIIAGLLGPVLALSVMPDSNEPRSFTLRRPTRPELTDFVGNVSGIALFTLFAAGCLGSLLGWLFDDSGEVSLSLLFLFGSTFAVVKALGVANKPPPAAAFVRPMDSHRNDQRRTVIYVLVPGIVIGSVFGLMIGSVLGLLSGLTLGLTVGLAAGRGAAFDVTLAETALAVKVGRVHFMALLETAAQPQWQLLRQAGAVYQFRHAALQDLLAAGTPARAAS